MWMICDLQSKILIIYLNPMKLNQIAAFTFVVLCHISLSAQEEKEEDIQVVIPKIEQLPGAVKVSDDNYYSFSLNDYTSPQNKVYWKYRKPNAAYWQQDVWYTIQAELDDEKENITGKENLVYTNNSPDDITELYFHLYQNAFQPESYMSKLGEANFVKYEYGKYEGQKLGTVISTLKIDGQAMSFEIDNTIMRIKLFKPLKAGKSIVIDLDFVTYFDNKGTMRRRMKTFVHDGVKQFDGVHWYPRISVYDRKFGWTTDQHLGHEFYGNFGQFNVELTLPNNYIVEATGVLTNENEALPESLKKSIDISNYALKDGINNYKFSIPKTGKKTWKYQAINVHDFAFTADPSYRRMVTTISEPANPFGKIECIALCQEANAPYWQPTSAFVAEVVKTYNKDFGVYLYNKIVAADARDGMEYPMITLNGGNWPGHQYVIAHEVGHNWFFGHVGNNETYRASLDEGFTQFLTAWSIKNFRKDKSSPNVTDYQMVYRGYMGDAQNFEHTCLNTHSDDFESALGHGGGYRQVYYKTATMLYNLQYVLGDELFTKAMQHYFVQWRLANPYFDDFRSSIINYTKVDLNWFFDQWLETEKELDYKIARVKTKKLGNDSFEYQIKIKRVGEMTSPIDLSLTNQKGGVTEYIIPNTNFAKDGKATVLPKWTGWGKLNPTYTATIVSKGPLNQIEIDKSQRLADYNPNNNTWKKNAIWHLDKGQYPTDDLRKVSVGIRPDIWYNNYDGVKVGLNLERNYGRLNNTQFAAWYSTGIGAYPIENIQFYQYQFGHKRTLGYGLNFETNLRYKEGLEHYSAGVSKSKGKNIYKANIKAMNRHGQFNNIYTPFQNNWLNNQWNNILNLSYQRNMQYFGGNTSARLFTKNSFLFSDYNFAEIGIEIKNQLNNRKFPLRSRLFGAYQTGNNIPLESRIYLQGANPEEMMDNKYTSAPVLWNNTSFGSNIGNYQWLSGGLNIRGMSNYAAPISDSIYGTPLYAGNKGFSISSELDFDQFINLQPKWFKKWLHVDAYVFGDAGMLFGPGQILNQLSSGITADAGIGTAYTVKSWGKFSKAKPFTLRIDFPFFINRLPATATGQYLDFRVVFGINRAI